MNEKYQEFYDYLKSENLTDLDAESFQTAYSEPEKYEELWGYVSQNNLTDLSKEDFFESYFGGVKKKEETVTASVSEPGSLVSPELEVPVAETVVEEEVVQPVVADATRVEEPVLPIEQIEQPDLEEFVVYEDPGAEVVAEAEGEKNTWVEDFAGKNFVTDFFGDMYRAGVAGKAQGASVDESLELMTKGKDVTDEDIEDFIAAQERMASQGESDEMKEFNKIYEANGSGWLGFLKGTANNPSILPQLFVSSVSAMALNLPILSAGAAGAGTGAAIGATGFSAGPLGVFTTAGGALTGAMGAMGTTLETGLAFSEFLQEQLEKKGLEMTTEGIRKVLEDPEAIKSMRYRAAGRGITIGAFNAVTAGVGSQVVKSVAKATGRKVVAGLAGAGVEVVSESAGEVAGRLVAGQEMDVAEIGFEGFAGGPAQLVGIGRGLLKSPTYKINNETVSGPKIADFIKNAPIEDLTGATLEIKNDPVLKDIAVERRENARMDAIIKAELEKAGITDEGAVTALTKLEKERRGLEGNGTRAAQQRLAEVNKEIDGLMDGAKIAYTETVDASGDKVTTEVIVTKEYAKEELIKDGIESPTEQQVEAKQAELFEDAMEAVQTPQEDAIQEPSPETVDAPEPTRGSEAMGEGVPDIGEPTAEVEAEDQVAEAAPTEEVAVEETVSEPTQEVTEEEQVDIDDFFSDKEIEGVDKIDDNLVVNRKQLSQDKAETAKEERKISRIKQIAKKAAVSLKKQFPDVKIVLHETEGQYKRFAGKRARGTYLGNDKTIHINLSIADLETMGHEVFHAILLETVKNDPNAVIVSRKMLDSIKKVVDPNSKLAERIDKFVAKYADAPIVQDEEYLAELMGILSAEYTTLDKPAQNAIKEFLRKLAKLIGIDKKFGLDEYFGPEFLKTDAEVIDLLNTVSRKVSQGAFIEASDVAVIDKIRKKSTPEELKKARKDVEKALDEQEARKAAEERGIMAREQIVGERASLEDDVRDGLDMAMLTYTEQGDSKKVRREVKAAWGWEKGADGKWRYEIETGELKKVPNGTYKLSDVYDAPELYKAYPEVKDISLTINVRDAGAEDSWFIINKNAVEINVKNYGRVRPDLIHELQHYIQFKEGFAIGGNTNTAIDLINSLSPDKLREINILEGKESAMSMLSDIAEESELTYVDDLKSIDTIEDFLNRNTKDANLLNSLYGDDAASYVLGVLNEDLIDLEDGDLMGGIYQVLQTIQEQTENKDGRSLWSPYAVYQRLIGEVEARNAAFRDGGGRSLIEDSEDTPREDQLAVFGEQEKVLRKIEAKEEMTEQELDALDLAKLPAQEGSNKGAGLFYGPRATIANYESAKTMFADGAPAEDIEMLTGWNVVEKQNGDVVYVLSRNEVESKDTIDKAIASRKDRGVSPQQREKKAAEENLLNRSQEYVQDFDELERLNNEGVMFHFGPVDIQEVMPEKLRLMVSGYGIYFVDKAESPTTYSLYASRYGKRVTLVDGSGMNLVDSGSKISKEEFTTLMETFNKEVAALDEVSPEITELSEYLNELDLDLQGANPTWSEMLTTMSPDLLPSDSDFFLGGVIDKAYNYTNPQKMFIAEVTAKALGYDGATSIIGKGSIEEHSAVNVWNFDKVNKNIISDEAVTPRMQVEGINPKDVRMRSRSGNRVGKGLSVKKVNNEAVVEEIPDLTLDYVRENAPASYLKNANLIAQYPLVRGVKNFDDVSSLEQADEVYEVYARQVADNLNWIMESYPEEYREISTLWYDGANKIANELAADYGVSPEQVAGIIASLSPQNDWYQNVRAAELLLLAFRENPVMSQKMIDYQVNYAEGKINKLRERIKSAGEAKGKSQAKAKVAKFKAVEAKNLKAIADAEALLDLLRSYKGKRMEDAPDALKPYYVRLYNEVNQPKSYPIISPDGNYGSDALTDAGGKRKFGWGSYTEIGKGVSIRLDGSQENISVTLGQMHKIRNFFNNIIDPMSKEKDITMDTHAIAAALLIPASSKTKEVVQNFGTGTANSGVKGQKGLYYANQAGYFLSAEENNMLPRQVQSVTWEAVRGLFTSKFKDGAKNVKSINDIWENYAEGNITIEQARQEVLEKADGINAPSWAGLISDESRDGDGTTTERGRGKRGGPAAEREGVAPRQQVVYHVTVRDNKGNIQKKGLEKDRPPTFAKGIMGTAVFDTAGKSFAFSNLEDATKWGIKTKIEKDKEVSIVAINAEGKTLQEDKAVTEDPFNPLSSAVFTEDVISPSDILSIEDVDYKFGKPFDKSGEPLTEDSFDIKEDIAPRQQLEDIATPLPRQQKSVREVVQQARDNNFKDAATKDFLKRKGVPTADIDKAIKTLDDVYARVMKEIDGVITKSQKRGVDFDTQLKNALAYLQGTKLYENTTDIHREKLIREVRAKFDKKEKRAPSAKRILGDIKDVKTVTLKEKEALKMQLRLVAKTAKTTARALVVAGNELTKSLKEMVKGGVITASQMSSVLRRFSRVDLFNPASIDSFLDYMAKIFADAEYGAKIARIKKLLPRAKKNIKSKIGVADVLGDTLTKLFNVNPTLIPMEMLEDYQNLLEMMGAAKKVLPLADINDVTEMANKLLNAVYEEVSMAEDLAEVFANYENKVIKDGKVDYAATVRAMIADETISEAEATVMIKYKSRIVESTTKEPKTEEELAEERAELMSAVEAAKVNVSRLVMDEERTLARQLSKLMRTEAIDRLSNQQLETLLAVIDNINNGFVTHAAQRLAETMNASNRAKSLLDSIIKAVPLPVSTFVGKIKSGITKNNKFFESIKRNPLAYIDQVFGDFQTTRIYDAVFKPLAQAYDTFSLEMKKVDERLTNAQEAVMKSFKNDPNKARMSSYKMMAYMLQREFEANPDNKQVNPAADFIRATIDHINKGQSFFKGKDAEMLQQILDDFGGEQIDSQKLYDSFNKAERNALSVMEDINKSMGSKAVFTGAVIRGRRVDALNQYAHHNVLSTSGQMDRSADVALIEAYNQSMRASTKAKNLIERTGAATPLNFDVFSSVSRGSRFTLTDFYLTEPIRTSRKTISDTRKLLEERGDVTKQENEIVNAIENALELTLDDLLTRTFSQSTMLENVIQYVKKTGYRLVLASGTRAMAEGASNLAFAAIYAPKDFAVGRANKTVLGAVGIDVMSNLKSTQISRMYPNEILSGRMIDTSVLGEKAGDKGGRAKSDVLNKATQIYNGLLSPAKKGVEIVADTLISYPDKAVIRPLWFGSFENAFVEITGKKPDFEKIAANDEAYMAANQEALNKATDTADQLTTLAGAADNPFKSMLRGKYPSKAKQTALLQFFNNFNSFMTRFLIYEYISARTAVNAMLGNGMISKRQGAALLGAVTTRMIVYTLAGTILNQIFKQAFGLGDEEDEKDIEKQFGQALASTATSLIVGRDFGNVVKGLLNYGVENLNEEFLDELRDGDYDPYRDAIAYTFVPPDKEYKSNTLADYIRNLMGPFGPFYKMAEFGVKALSADEKKDPAARIRQQRELNERLPLELLGNLGLIPLYRDIRSLLLADIYKGMGKDKKGSSTGMTKAEKAQMKEYFPEMYEMQMQLEEDMKNPELERMMKEQEKAIEEMMKGLK